MAEPFVFHFSLDEQQRPQLMAMIDLSCACTLCGHPQLQRFYRALPYHAMTWRALTRQARQAHQLAAYECENCGSPVGPEAVQTSVLTYGFADHAGEVLLYATAPAEPDGSPLLCQVKPLRRLDPQVQPVFRPVESLGPILTPEPLRTQDELDALEVEVSARLSRVFSLKVSWLELVAQQRRWPDEPAWARQAPGVWAMVGSSQGALDEVERWLQSHDEDFAMARDSGQLLSCSLPHSAPVGLATYERPELLQGQWSSWFGPATRCLVRAQDASQMLEYTLQTARLTYTLEGAGPQAVIHQITTPREGGYSRPVHLEAVLRRAIFTGVSPGEAARQTAEEIVGLLLRVWSQD